MSALPNCKLPWNISDCHIDMTGGHSAFALLHVGCMVTVPGLCLFSRANFDVIWFLTWFFFTFSVDFFTFRFSLRTEDFALGGHAKLSDLEDGLARSVRASSLPKRILLKFQDFQDTYGSLQSKRLLEVRCEKNRSLVKEIVRANFFFLSRKG